MPKTPHFKVCHRADTITPYECFYGCLMDVYYTGQFVLPLPQGHRFPMAKYHMLRDRLAAEYQGIDETVQVQMNTYRVALAYAAKWQSWQNKA